MRLDEWQHYLESQYVEGDEPPAAADAEAFRTRAKAVGAPAFGADPVAEVAPDTDASRDAGRPQVSADSASSGDPAEANADDAVSWQDLPAAPPFINRATRVGASQAAPEPIAPAWDEPCPPARDAAEPAASSSRAGPVTLSFALSEAPSGAQRPRTQNGLPFAHIAAPEEVPEFSTYIRRPHEAAPHEDGD